MGLTVSNNFRMRLTRAARDNALPFAPLMSHEETVAAMRETRRKDQPRFDSVEAPMRDLHAEDRARAQLTSPSPRDIAIMRGPAVGRTFAIGT